MKKKSLCLTGALGVVCLFVVSLIVPLSTQAKDVVEWRWVNLMPAKHWSSQLHKEMCEEVAKETNGGFKINFFPGDMLVASRDAVQATVRGTVQLNASGGNYIQGVIPVLGGDQLPFGGVSDEEWQEMLTDDGPLRKFSEDIMEEHGLEVLARWIQGNNGVASRKKLSTIPDWKGVKIRLFPLNVSVGKALGAEPVVMTGDEAADATRRGVLEASMLNAGAAYARGYGEFCDYYIEWPLGMMQITLIANKKAIDALPPEYEEALRQAVKKMEDKLWKAYYKDRDASYEKLEKQGVEVIFPEEEEIEKFSETADPFNEFWADKHGENGRELLRIVGEYQ